MRRIASLSVLMLSSCVHADGPAAPTAKTADRPRLVVLIVIDQFRGDFPERYGKHFGRDGFRRLMERGAYYPDAQYSHGSTATGPGHACIATGSNPRTHGISANQDAHGECVEDRDYPVVGGASKSKSGVSPKRLLVPALGDVMKNASGGRAKVVSVGLKSRAVALLAGKKADGAYWFDSGSGRFVTSLFYGTALAKCIEEMNQSRLADRWFGRRWERALPAAAYADCDADDEPSEIDLFGLGRTFPHTVDGGLKSPGPAYYAALETTPFGDEMVLEAAARLLEGESLGKDGECDLLCVAMSAFDMAGHFFGPDSHEMLDMTVREDRALEGFFKTLDEKVGAGRYVVALTADHGVTPTAAHSKRQGRDAGTVRGKDLLAKLNAHMAEANRGEGGDFRPVALIELPWLHLDRKAIEKRGLSADAVLGQCKDWLEKQPGVEWARQASRIAEPIDNGAGERRRLAHEAYHPGMAGDLYIALRPWWHKSGKDQAASHGTYHACDRHVPIMLFGPGIAAGRRAAGDPIDIAPTLCALLGIERPASMTGRVRTESLGVDIKPTR